MKLEDNNNWAKPLLLIIGNNVAKHGVGGEFQAEGIEEQRPVSRGVEGAEEELGWLEWRGGPQEACLDRQCQCDESPRRGRRLSIRSSYCGPGQR